MMLMIGLVLAVLLLLGFRSRAVVGQECLASEEGAETRQSEAFLFLFHPALALVDFVTVAVAAAAAAATVSISDARLQRVAFLVLRRTHLDVGGPRTAHSQHWTVRVSDGTGV